MAHIERGLTSGERALAGSMFGAALDYAPVRLHRGKWFLFQPAWVTMAPDGGVWFHPNGGLWRDDYADEVTSLRALLIHELTHVWQRQCGINLVLRRPPLARYAYTLAAGKPLAAYGLEQQAMIVEHVWRARERGRPDPALEALLPFTPPPPPWS